MNMNKSGRVLIVALIVIASVIFLIFSAITENSGVEITITDLYENTDEFVSRYIVLEGELDPVSVKWDADNIELSFTITDEKGKRLSVLYKGIKPDGFYDDVIAIVNGKYDPVQDLFIADTLQTRCPSSYEAPAESTDEM